MNKIKFSSKFKKEFKKYIDSDYFKYNDSFRLPFVRDLLSKDRFFNIFSENMIYGDSEKITKQTIEHNSDIARMFYSEMSNRPDLISKPLSCINSIKMNAHKMKVLTIGCRTEAEIFSLVDAGFNLDNITGVDLFSYTPLIEIGDITELSYSDDSFDVLICGWVLEFVTDLDKAISEMRRVTKKGGLIAIGGMHHPSSMDLENYNKRKKHNDRIWYASIENIKDVFNTKDDDFVFKSGVDEQDKDKRGDVVAIFKNSKE